MANKIIAIITVLFFAGLISLYYGNTLFILFESDEPSESIGTPGRGALKNGKRLPSRGGNFSAYSRLGALLGRNSVHHRVRDCVVEAYRAMHEKYPDKVFVYGETGRPSGGSFKPHKTHQNGLSVDFMVPVMDDKGRSLPLPASPFNKFGYGIEFDRAGRADELQIDFEAMAAHIFELQSAAGRTRLKIQKIIFAPELQPHLFKTEHGKKIRASITFSSKPAWVRHDEHYHVDFVVNNELE